MAKVYKNRIETTAGYTLNSETPLDDRLSVATLSDLDTLVFMDIAYDNMIVGVSGLGVYKYNKADNTWTRQAKVKKILRDGKYVEVLSDLLDDNAVNTLNIANNAVTENKLATEFTETLLRGTAGTAPMNEGDYLKAGTIYIQYDEV